MEVCTQAIAIGEIWGNILNCLQTIWKKGCYRLCRPISVSQQVVSSKLVSDTFIQQLTSWDCDLSAPRVVTADRSGPWQLAQWLGERLQSQRIEPSCPLYPCELAASFAKTPDWHRNLALWLCNSQTKIH